MVVCVKMKVATVTFECDNLCVVVRLKVVHLLLTDAFICPARGETPAASWMWCDASDKETGWQDIYNTTCPQCTGETLLRGNRFSD